MSNGRAERMVRPIKYAVKKMIISYRMDWEEYLPRVLYGYCRRRLSAGDSPFEIMFGIVPRMYLDNSFALTSNSLDKHRAIVDPLSSLCSSSCRSPGSLFRFRHPSTTNRDFRTLQHIYPFFRTERDGSSPKGFV